MKKSEFREYAESFIWALALALFIRTFIVAPFRIPTGSMRQTLMEGDRILVDKVVYGIKIPFAGWRLPAVRKPARGDIVVFRSPEDRRKDYIKRLVGLGVDQVEIRDLHLWVNGTALMEPPIFRDQVYYNRGVFGQQGRPITVPPGHYFFLGDNSASSRGSRYWGFVSEDKIIGRAFMIFWPPKRIRFLK